MRKNGFQAPLEPLQVLTWVLLLIIVAEFYAFLVPVMARTYAIGLGIAYGILAALSAVTGIVACVINPVDPNVERYHKGEPTTGATQDKTFCFLCQLHVNKGSRHCRYCDKCVDKFDHHCRWLNNCVGRKNYWLFVALLTSTLLMTSLQIAISVWTCVGYHTDDARVLRRIRDRYGDLSDVGYIAIVYAVAVLLVPFVGLLVQLLGFHIMLILGDITTYDYIVREQKRERERKMRRSQKAQERARRASGGQSSSDSAATAQRTAACCQPRDLCQAEGGNSAAPEGVSVPQTSPKEGATSAPTSVVPGRGGK